MAELKRVAYTHDAMIDIILQEPTVSTSELAQLFHYSPGWISAVIHSDSFQARLAQRKGALIDPLITRSVNERMRSVASRAIDLIDDRLGSGEASADFALEALGIATGALGYGHHKA